MINYYTHMQADMLRKHGFTKTISLYDVFIDCDSCEILVDQHNGVRSCFEPIVSCNAGVVTQRSMNRLSELQP